jgi:predicted Rossmann fold nucleotide-binding protein DprA/Smf involved in DNA uptake
LFNRKNSEGRTNDPMAFMFWFQQDLGKTVISAGTMDDIADDPEIASKLSLRDRIAALVRREPQTMVQIAEALDATVQTVSTTVRRAEAQGVLARIMGPDNVYRIIAPEGHQTH